ncbi:hypothetical protein ACFYT4_28450 [Streptomyces sp. NPDC004609]|uniref:hypothetical protein n=1 Tax=Streptomyces sp. NPDC004609 TaxID=3364704 RepID=UPI00369E5990
MPPASPSLASYVEQWNPSPRTADDPLPPGPVAALSAVLDLPGPAATAGGPVPPLWHWLYFLHRPAQRELGADGHPLHGHFLPPLPERQRMFAGGRCDIRQPLRLGEPAERISSLGTVTARHGRTGELLFVTQRNEFRQQGRTCVIEEQDIVYRSGRGSGAHVSPVPDHSRRPAAKASWQIPLRPDAPLLFRFSALTANTHRIHYDEVYARDEEGYPGLVVHGPLLALLMLELVRRNAPRRQVRSLSYRLRRPLFAGEHLLASGDSAGDRADLRIGTHREARHATAEVTFA